MFINEILFSISCKNLFHKLCIFSSLHDSMYSQCQSCGKNYPASPRASHYKK